MPIAIESQRDIFDIRIDRYPLTPKSGKRGLLRWKNDSSYLVKWVVITEFGSASGNLKPNGEHELPNDPSVSAAAIYVDKDPVFVLSSTRLEPGVDIKLIAADIIPRGSHSTKPSSRKR